MPFVAVDSEGDTGRRGLMSMSWFDGVSSGYTEDHKEMIGVLTDYAKRGYDFLCHNAEYDIATLFWQLGIPVEVEMYGGRFHHGQWKVKASGRMCRLWDTAAIAAYLPLGSLGQALHLPKYETPQILTKGTVDRFKWKCDRHDTWECMDCYAVRDAEITFRYFEFYRDLLARFLVEPKHTLGSAAVAIWQKTDATGPINILSGKVDELCRASYRGGRTELIKPGWHETLYEADVNSMYPYVMMANPYPDMRHLRYAEGSSIPDGVLDREGVSECLVDVPRINLPVLGAIREGYAYYPVGLLRGTWTHVELRAATERGARVRSIVRSVWAEGTRQPFTTFVIALHELKQEYDKTDDPRRLVIKIILNALYGRMGLKLGMVRSRVVPMALFPKGRNQTGWEMCGGWPPTYGKRDYQVGRVSKFANVLWASYITAYARLELLKHMETAGKGLVYCDTDSVFSLNPIGVESKELGDLSFKSEYQRGRFLAPKLYEVWKIDGGHVVKAKGVPNAAAVEYLNQGQATFDRPTRLKEAMHKGGMAATWIQVKKQRMTVPARRQPVDPDVLLSGKGWSDTVPVVFSPEDCEDPIDE